MIGIAQQLITGLTRESPHAVPASLFFRDEKFGLENLPFDLLINESHSMRFDISDHAVENGVTISDMVTRRLRSVSVTGLFTNHSLAGADYVDDDGEWTTEKIELDGQEAVTNSSLERYEQLQELASKKEPVRLVTSLEIYNEMIITDLTANRGASDGESIQFTMTLREVKSVDLSSILVSATKNDGSTAERRAMQDKENYGLQPATKEDRFLKD